MLSLRHGSTEGAEGREPVNVLAIYVANEHILSLLEEATSRRFLLQPEPGLSLRDRIASAAAGLRRLLGSPVDSAGVAPKLEGYPYRS